MTLTPADLRATFPPADLRVMLSWLGLTPAEFAQHLDEPEQSVQEWLSGTAAFPRHADRAVWLLFDAAKAAAKELSKQGANCTSSGQTQRILAQWCEQEDGSRWPGYTGLSNLPDSFWAQITARFSLVGTPIWSADPILPSSHRAVETILTPPSPEAPTFVVPRSGRGAVTGYWVGADYQPVEAVRAFIAETGAVLALTTWWGPESAVPACWANMSTGVIALGDEPYVTPSASASQQETSERASNPEATMTVGALRVALRWLGLTSEDLVHFLSVPQETVDAWLSGATPVPPQASRLLRDLDADAQAAAADLALNYQANPERPVLVYSSTEDMHAVALTHPDLPATFWDQVVARAVAQEPRLLVVLLNVVAPVLPHQVSQGPEPVTAHYYSDRASERLMAQPLDRRPRLRLTLSALDPAPSDD